MPALAPQNAPGVVMLLVLVVVAMLCSMCSTGTNGLGFRSHGATRVSEHMFIGRIESAERASERAHSAAHHVYN